MRLICPNCAAQYEVADTVIPDEGRDVQCSNCGTTWFQESAAKLAAAAKRARADDPADMAAAPDDEAVNRDDLPPEPDATPPEPVGPEPDEAPNDPEQAMDSIPKAPEPDVPQSSLSSEDESVLKEEAELERRMRMAEAAVETQTEMPVDEPVRPRRVRSEDLRTVEQPVDDSPDLEETSAAVSAAVAKGRSQLPDIEEINSTLTETTTSVRDALDEASAASAPPKRTGFRAGFLLAVFVAVAAVAAYVYSPQLADRFPSTAPYLISFVEFADGLRLRLNEFVAGLVQRLDAGS